MSAPNPRHIIDDSLVGWLESPSAMSPVSRFCTVSGWIFSTDEAIRHLVVRHGTSSHIVAVGLDRPDVAAAYPSTPAARASGFHASVTLAAKPTRSTPLEVCAVLSTGVERRVFRWRPAPAVAFATQVARRLRRGTPPAAPEPQRSEPVLARQRMAELTLFLQSGSRLDLTPVEPRVSVIIVTWNRAELTFGCLRALEHGRPGHEVIIVDNGSSDLTPTLLKAVRGATVIRNGSNAGFLTAANQGAAAATTDFIFFLNNDAEILPGSVEHLVSSLARSPDVGAVGGRLVWPDGRLQEAGSIVWQNGGCEGYGRGADPTAPEYSFKRDVDYCSGALLLTRRSLFQELGGFDDRYRPAYYEDVDYCVRLWRRGYRVQFEPRATAIHVEFGSSSSPAHAIALQARNQSTFTATHGDWLAAQLPRSAGVLRARSRPHRRRRLLYIDDLLPDAAWGCGFPRAAAFLRCLEAEYAVTVYPTRHEAEGPDHAALFPDVELMTGSGPNRLASFLAERRHFFDLIIVSRSHNLQFLKAAIPNLPSLGVPVVYDAEALSTAREILRREVQGRPIAAETAAALVAEEIALAAGCSAVLAVNELERQRFAAAGHRAFVLGHAAMATGGVAPFCKRDTILFVAALAWGGPNEDAADLLANAIQPRLRERFGTPPDVVITGRGAGGLRPALERSGVTVEEGTADLEPFYERARVFIAPSRFAAGIPLKVIEAAARGVPVVCSTLLARQLGWENGRDLLTADTPDAYADAVTRLFSDESVWSNIRANALERVSNEHSAVAFTQAVRAVLDCVGSGGT